MCSIMGLCVPDHTAGIPSVMLLNESPRVVVRIGAKSVAPTGERVFYPG